MFFKRIHMPGMVRGKNSGKNIRERDVWNSKKNYSLPFSVDMK